MFALSFTRLAAKSFRRVAAPKNARKTSIAPRVAARLAAVAIVFALALSSTAQAGKFGGGSSGGNRSGGNSFRSQSSQRVNSAPKSVGSSMFKHSSGGSNSGSLHKKFNHNVGSNHKPFHGNVQNLKNTQTLGKIQAGPKVTLPIKSNITKFDPKVTTPRFPTQGQLGGVKGKDIHRSPIQGFPINKKLTGSIQKQLPIKIQGNGNAQHPAKHLGGNNLGDILNKKIGLGNLGGQHHGNHHHHHGKVKHQHWNWCWTHHHKKTCYKPCHQQWHCWNYPRWNTLHRHQCGYYVDVPVVVVHGIDLQLLAVRFVDSGDASQNMGPRFRVWVRNNTPTPTLKPFNVLVMAAQDAMPAANLPQAGVRIETMQPGQILPIDVRLPIEAGDANLGTIHVLVDSHREVPEVFEDNNGIVLPKTQILSVDPALLAIDRPTATPGSEVIVAGEGLTAQSGQVIVKLAGLDLAAEVIGWSELGIQFRLPTLPLAGAANAQIVAIRADGTTLAPLAMQIVPGQATTAAAGPEAVEPAAFNTTSQPTAVQAMFGQ